MSRAFVDDDSEQREELPEIPQSTNPGYITPDGLEMLEAELQRLEETERPPLLATIEEGGPGTTQAEIELARVAQRVKYLQGRIARAIVIDPAASSHDRVHFGSTVSVRDQNGEEMRVHIVGEDETDPDHGRVSCFSPLARALMLKQVGETAVWHRPIGDLTLTVLSID